MEGGGGPKDHSRIREGFTAVPLLPCLLGACSASSYGASYGDHGAHGDDGPPGGAQGDGALMGGARGGAGQAEQGTGGRLPRHQGRDLCQDRGVPAGQEGTLPGVVVAGLGRRGGC